MTEEYDFLFKIVLIGDSSVGKSNILLRYVSNDFQKESRTTIGVLFQSKFITTADGLIVRAQIWDTAGEERYKSVSKVYYRGAVGALLIYDITNRRSFENCAEWLNRLKENSLEDIIIMLVGNKTDLVENREVSLAEGEEFAQKNELAFMETSALDGNNVATAFDTTINSKSTILFKF